jgi:hypothetical protein
MAPSYSAAYPPLKGAFPPQQLWLSGYAMQCVGTVRGKEGGIQVFAGLAPSSQTVGSNISVIHDLSKVPIRH